LYVYQAWPCKKKKINKTKKKKKKKREKTDKQMLCRCSDNENEDRNADWSPSRGQDSNCSISKNREFSREEGKRANKRGRPMQLESTYRLPCIHGRGIRCEVQSRCSVSDEQ
jgi:hypothetical protein